MKIVIYNIDKGGKEKLYTPLQEHYIKSSSKFAKIEIKSIFTKEIAKAQDSTEQLAKLSYTNALKPFLGNGYDIVLDPKGESIDSYEFAKLIQNRSKINFYIGGAYGFEDNFINQCNKSISLGKITLSHKLIRLVLLEQLFRGLSIINNHPYHK